jgi:hypothetical protein
MTSIRDMTPRRRRFLALAAGGLMLMTGATATTLAAWQDHEYVWGGIGDTGTTGLTSTMFNVQQNTSTTDDSNFLDHEVSAADLGQLNFSVNAGALTPGDTVFAFMQLRTVAGSRGGTLTLAPATSTPSNALAAALTYGTQSGTTRASCTAAGFATNGTPLVPLGSPLAAGSGTTAFTLPAATASAPGAAVGLCFAVSLPAGTSRAVSGMTTLPVWHFDATSN